MILLKKITSGTTTVVIGPFVDDTDGKTPETALTISQGDVLLWKHGGTTFGAKNESSAATHRSNGLYTVALNDTDLNTEGQLILSVNETGALPVRHDFMVVPAHVYDGLVAGTDFLQVDKVQIAGSTTAATKQGAAAGVIFQGTVTNSGHTPTTTAFKCTDIVEATDDHWIGRRVIFTSGALLGQATAITDYAGATGVYTISALTEAPANADTFVIV